MSTETGPGPVAPQGLVYPCEYPIKIFFQPEAAVEGRLHSVIRRHLPLGAALKSGQRPSSNGKYVCLTVEFVAESEVHLMGIIRDILADPAVVLAL